MTSSSTSKSRLRARLRERRRGLDLQTRAAAALAICEQIVTSPHWTGARRVALYIANDSEMDTAPLAALCRDAGKLLYLPVMQADKTLSFAAWDADTALLRNSYGIDEPPASAARVAAADLDIIVLPLVGWDRQGTRLGMGGGYYDRSLAGVSGPVLAGLAYAMQESAGLPRDQSDVPLDIVVTEDGVHCCRQG